MCEYTPAVLRPASPLQAQIMEQMRCVVTQSRQRVNTDCLRIKRCLDAIFHLEGEAMNWLPLKLQTTALHSSVNQRRIKASLPRLIKGVFSSSLISAGQAGWQS